MSRDFPTLPADAERVVVPSRRHDAAEVIAKIMEQIEAAGHPHDACFAVRLALEEAISNALKHGNANDESKTITVEYSIDAKVVAVDIEDCGAGFKPECVPDPTLDENIELPSGRGVMLMRAYMTDVRFNDPGNRVALRYRRG